MKRILLLLTVAVVMAAMLAVMSGPAMARASEFLQTDQGTQLRLSQPLQNPTDGQIPNDPYQPASTQIPTDPLAPAATHAPDRQTCTPGTGAVCPKSTVT